MSFDYEKVKRSQETGEQWASYSDLFMVLSVVFLLLYVVASLRTGTYTLTRQLENQKLANKAEDLERQIKTYSALKENYLETQASQNEQEVYENLMGKLELLQEKNKKEAVELRKQADENEQKEVALNQYQQIIRNIINANMLSKARIKRRDRTIAKANTTIKQQKEDIATKVNMIKKREATIADKEKAIKQLDEEVAKRQQIITSKNKVIAEKQKVLNAKSREIKKLNKDIDKKRWVINKNKKQIKNINRDLKKQISALKDQKQKQIISAKAYQAQLAKLEQESKSKIADINRRNKIIQKKLSKVNGKVKVASNQLQDAKKKITQQELQKSRLSKELVQAQKEFQKTKKTYFIQLKSLKSEQAKLNKDLEQAKELLNAKKKIAKQIQQNFKKAGIKAQVDAKTGEVTLSFGKHFFQTGKANLNKPMEDILNKFMPIYADSIFKDPKIAKKIKAVDIIGFASPTYRGKYINPNSLNPKDKKAIEYNTDLSIRRANSVFKHIIDTNKLKYTRQRDIQPLLKVSGRSFFSGAMNGRAPASDMSRKEFCKKYDCQKEQRVIIKFELDN